MLSTRRNALASPPLAWRSFRHRLLDQPKLAQHRFGGALAGFPGPGNSPRQRLVGRFARKKQSAQRLGKTAVEAAPQEVRPAFLSPREKNATPVFLGWTWLSIAVLLYIPPMRSFSMSATFFPIRPA